MVRIQGRPLKGSELRHLENSLRNAGVKREIFRSIQRGDSPAAINRLFKQAGYNFDRFGIADYIARTYKHKTSVTYFDKIAARYGSRSAINVESFRRAGWGGKVQITIEGIAASGDSVHRTIEIDGAKYQSIGDLTDDILSDVYEEFLEKYFEGLDVSIANIRFY